MIIEKIWRSRSTRYQKQSNPFWGSSVATSPGGPSPTRDHQFARVFLVGGILPPQPDVWKMQHFYSMNVSGPQKSLRDQCFCATPVSWIVQICSGRFGVDFVMVTTVGVLTRSVPSPMFSMRTGLPWSKDISKVLNILSHFWMNRKSKPICSNGTIYLQLHSGRLTEQWEMNHLKTSYWNWGYSIAMLVYQRVSF